MNWLLNQLQNRESIFTRGKLILILIIVLISSFTMTNIINYYATKNFVTNNTKSKTLPLISENILSELQEDLVNPVNNSSLMAHDEFLINWIKDGEKDDKKIAKYLKRIKEEYGYLSAFFISDLTRNYYYEGGILKQISPEDDHDIWYYKFLDLNKPYDLDVDTNEAHQGAMTVFINHRLEDQDGGFLGVTGVGLEMESIGSVLESYQERFGHLIYMIDSQGVIQVHPNLELIENAAIGTLPGLTEISKEILLNREGLNIYEYKSNNNSYILSSRYFPDFDWFLIVESDETEILSTARNYLIGNLVIGGFATLTIILLVTITV
ncbi:MAG: cache domain-containing protein, partial [Anaerolineaceae bacterium]|nr:cache domain-containing protein [Anaerolineaceae bacterium]